jgi:acetyl/propionyl-CoA carboxylase alpha subunit
MIRRLLVANRAEIAERVIRTARARGTETVAVFSDVDAQLPYVAAADAAVRLAGTSATDTYLRSDLLVDAALRMGADAVHPGYGFLSERAEFARACVHAGLTFVGPPAAVIESMGSKIEAKRLMRAAGVPVLEGVTVADGAVTYDVATLADKVGYPLLVKATLGGGGRGMRVVEAPDGLADAVAAASREAEAAFGSGEVFLERLVVAPRHVEVQVIGDVHGTVVHLFERECSIQRRHQKLLEESPSPGITSATRDAMCDAAVAAARAIGYVNAGTVEFVVGADEQFFFLEVNTRLQVEHPVTELVTGLDLVELQLQVAEGLALGDEVIAARTRGHAIEVRLYAEDPDEEYLPSSGRLERFEIPRSEGVRVDAGYATGTVVGTDYDAMLAKVIAWAPTRLGAARRLAAALRGARLHGVATNRDLLVGVLADDEFVAGGTDTAFLERHPPHTLCSAARDPDDELYCVVAAIWQRLEDRPRSPQPSGIPVAWRNVGPSSQPKTFVLRGTEHVVDISGAHGARRLTLDDRPIEFGWVEVTATTADAELDGRTVRASIERAGETIYVDGTFGSVALTIVPRLGVPAIEEAPGSLHAPLPGAVRRVAVSAGDVVADGDTLMILEAMKMEHAIRAPRDGIVSSVLVADGDQVDRGAILAVVTAPELEAT